MSIDLDELKRIKEEMESTEKKGETNVRVRNDLHCIVKGHVRDTKYSISKFVNLATIEKLIRDTEK